MKIVQGYTEVELLFSPLKKFHEVITCIILTFLDVWHVSSEIVPMACMSLWRRGGEITSTSAKSRSPLC